MGVVAENVAIGNVCLCMRTFLHQCKVGCLQTGARNNTLLLHELQSDPRADIVHINS